VAGWWVLPVTVFAVCVLVGLRHPEDALSERGTIEVGSAVLWFVGGLSAAAFARKSRPSERVIQLWLMLLGLLCGARELDLQLWMNPKRIGEWGVRFRIDWWISSAVPLGIKLAWVVVFVTIGVIVYVMARRTLAMLSDKANPVRRIPLRRNPAVGLFLLAMFSIFLGWVSDDVLRGLTHPIWGAMWEESVEFLGAAVFVSVPAAVYGVSMRSESPGPTAEMGEAVAAGAAAT
jgi:hypothetical protein